MPTLQWQCTLMRPTSVDILLVKWRVPPLDGLMGVNGGMVVGDISEFALISYNM